MIVCACMLQTEQTFMRQKVTLASSGFTGAGVLRYALHLRFLCPFSKKYSDSRSVQRRKSDPLCAPARKNMGTEQDRRFYLYNDLRVVFPQRHSDADEGKVGVYHTVYMLSFGVLSKFLVISSLSRTLIWKELRIFFPPIYSFLLYALLFYDCSCMWNIIFHQIPNTLTSAIKGLSSWWFCFLCMLYICHFRPSTSNGSFTLFLTCTDIHSQ